MLQPFEVDSKVKRKVFLALVTAYSSSTRYYHNLDHIQQILETVEQMRSQAVNFPAIQLAAWFHDVIYDSRANDNEEQSAAYAETSLKALKLPITLIASVKFLILNTKTHQAQLDNIDSQILLDADLAILGASESNYKNYTQAIRQEYSWLPDEAFRTGRQQVLQNFLQRNRIYLTELLFLRLEEKARGNMQAELMDLSSPKIQ
ncbi:MAG TPA: hypothetical protein V6C95_16075 [Coleofasciculaceae cyanobacterium]